MATEIERKFLLASDAWRAQVTRSQAMRQGYLTDAPGKSSVRVRIEGERATLNIKAAVAGAARAEYEYEIPLADAAEMFRTLCGNCIEKTRHYVPQGALTWEIDEFGGANAGLVVAEIELDSAEQTFERPVWMGREVTDERRYYNHHLAMHPYSTWADEH
ncbi:MAG TPA: CYTH domain-containing protein [Nevskiaceae bacterium]|nr:CYTH domain-containing protein [Nevskiaceae bacterium]